MGAISMAARILVVLPSLRINNSIKTKQDKTDKRETDGDKTRARIA